jgi:hypothetical protein
MATDSVLGLFQTPEQYQLAQQAAQMEQARAYAAQDPMQRAVAAQYFAGGQLGRALGGEDPMLKLQSTRASIMRQVDQTDPNSLAQAAQALNQAGDVQGARALAQAAQEAAFKQSQITKNLREGNAAMLTTEQRNFMQARQEGYQGSFNQWLTEQNKSKGVNVGFSPEIKMTDKELDWRKQFLSENKPVIEQAASVQQALGLLQQSQQSPFADAAFANTVVSAFGGDKQKSKSEIDRLVKAGALDERVANTVKGFFEGTTSAKTKEDQLNVLKAVDKVLEQRYNSSAQSWSKRLSASKVNPELVVPTYGETVGATSTSIPVGKTVRNKAGEKFTVNADGTLTPVGK